MKNRILHSFKRYEKKYLISKEQQERIIEAANNRLIPDTYGKYTISNIYYDTDNWDLIRASIEKPIYKEKLRVRSYGVPKDYDKVFVEIKKKFDGIVYKRRVDVEADSVGRYLYGGLDLPDEGQIHREIKWFQQFYKAKPKVFIGYDRMAFAGADDEELRITFDSNLRWRDTELDLRAGNYGQLIIPEEQILMEIKISGASPVWLSRILSEFKIFPVSFSKYGTCYKKYLFNREKKEGMRVA